MLDTVWTLVEAAESEHTQSQWRQIQTLPVSVTGLSGYAGLNTACVPHMLDPMMLDAAAGERWCEYLQREGKIRFDSTRTQESSCCRRVGSNRCFHFCGFLDRTHESLWSENDMHACYNIQNVAIGVSIFITDKRTFMHFCWRDFTY